MSTRSASLVCWAAFCGCLFGGTTCGMAAELVCLKTGFCLEVLSHATENGRVTLQMGTGSVELADSEIVSLERVKPSILPASASQAGAPQATPLNPVKPQKVDAGILLNQAADNQGLDTDFVRSVAQIESGLQTGALSRKGAVGLMQLMPGTAKELAVNPLRPSENALGGAKYLRALLLKYHNNSALALAAYNAGPGAVEKYHGVPPYSETRQYVRRVTREYDRLHAASLAKAKAQKSTLRAATPVSKPSATE